MLRMNKSFVVRMVAWSILILYLVCDFFLFTGPLKKELNQMFPQAENKYADAMAKNICAKVYNKPIFLSQVDRRVYEKIWRMGRTPKKVKDQEFQILRLTAMDELIDESLLRIKTKVNSERISVSNDEIDHELKRFKQKFQSPDKLKSAMKAQGIDSEKELRYRIAARIQQEKYILHNIQPMLVISEKQERAWYQSHLEKLTIPERRKMRHIFLSTLERPSSEAKATLSDILEKITQGAITFEKAASTISEDEQNKLKGGDLGWMRADRLPSDFAKATFTLPLHSPTLIQTKIGWHLVEIMDIKESETPSFATLKPMIHQSMIDIKREDAIKRYKQQLRQINRNKVETYYKVLQKPRTL